ncbi:MAG: flavodoxin domain-containing protein [Spirochaetota bacterium]
MRLSILYSSRYGSTQLAAEAIARGCEDRDIAPSDIELRDVREDSGMPAGEIVVIGAPIYGGTIPKAVSRFVEANLDSLLDRRVGIYLSCLYDGERAEKQLADNFPARLIAHSFGQYYVGGRVELTQLRWLDRVIMKRVGGIDHDVDKTNPAEIRRLIDDVSAL